MRFKAGFIRSMVMLAVALSAAGGIVRVARAEEIRSFDADIYLNKDASLSVIENITMDFGDTRHHGIYRDIPVRYERNGANYDIGLDVNTVTEHGASVPYKVTHEGRNLRIRIGDPNTMVDGVHMYRIGYTVRRAINYFDGAPEVYWNVTGNDWPYRIDSVRAHFFPPKGVSAQNIRIASYTGAYGSTRPGRAVKQRNEIYFAAGTLMPEEGLTIVAGLPKGSVSPPLSDQVYSLFGGWVSVVFMPLLALLILGRLYWTRGRDVEGPKAVGVEWEPPKNLSPAEVGTLVDERCDMADIVSTLVDLAARGYLKIEMVESKVLLFFNSKDYIFTRVKPADDKLSLHESLFMAGLFAGGDTVTLSDLRNKFYTHLPGIRKAIYQELTNKKMFAGNPESVRSTFIGIGIALLVVGFFGVVVLQGGMIPLWVGIGVAGVMTMLSAKAMPAKTREGSEALYQALGFQRFVRVAEKQRIEMLAKEDPTIFGRLLPYAMVLGVADQWANAFKDLLTEPPDWFVGPGYSHGFSSHAFINDLGSGMKTMGSTFASAPSSAGSGGSGFSGGGSGGGFGGGGGGSW